MRSSVLFIAILIPSLALAQNMDGYDASKGLGAPTYQTKAPPPSVEAEVIIENSDITIQHAQDVLEELGGEVKSSAPAPAKKPSKAIAAVTAPEPDIISSSSSKLELNFETEQMVLTDMQKSDILEQIFIPLKEQDDMRVVIVSHAASPDKQQSASRRTSLKRALEVQNFLEAKGIETEKVIVTPLGNTQQNANRIHLELSKL